LLVDSQLGIELADRKTLPEIWIRDLFVLILFPKFVAYLLNLLLTIVIDQRCDGSRLVPKRFGTYFIFPRS
jgi:hypothetical protein